MFINATLMHLQLFSSEILWGEGKNHIRFYSMCSQLTVKWQEILVILPQVAFHIRQVIIGANQKLTQDEMKTLSDETSLVFGFTMLL